MKHERQNPNLERPYLDCDGKNLYINVNRIVSKIPDPVKKTCENIRNYILKHPVKTVVGLTLLSTQIFWINVGYKSTKHQLDNGKARTEIESGIEKRMNDLPLKIIKLETMKQAQSAPSPATIFSLFLNEKFITTDLSICMDRRYDKVIAKELK